MNEDEAPPTLRRRLRVMSSLIVLVVLVGLLLAVQTKVLQVYIVISESMEPTLRIGDRILVDANAWPHRFDVVGFQDPEKPDKPEEQLIKRIVGVAGDEIEIRSGVLYINGEEQFSEKVTTNKINWRDIAPLRVPEDHLFVLGDNRNNSYDSLNFGPVRVSEVSGVMRYIIWPPSRIGAIPDFGAAPAGAREAAKK